MQDQFQDEDMAVQHFFLVAYKEGTGEWIVDDDAAFFPDTPLYDPQVNRFRKLADSEIARDVELREQLTKALGIKEASNE